ncbi:hypothetical protein [Streptomyces spiramenti]|uniref:DUF3558 domain-containing protein n=1 Tax=Streptomyces spiramenti TaxID=2720606 RepID=A0ABX1AJ51_9ACTN|nr:hypothetical protein [Streptomyces spiramenti]NJP67164.1 hypothetical protein [Streptomyces spiramenti]
MRRLRVLPAALLLAALPLTACGSGGDDDETADADRAGSADSADEPDGSDHSDDADSDDADADDEDGADSGGTDEGESGGEDDGAGSDDTDDAASSGGGSGGGKGPSVEDVAASYEDCSDVEPLVADFVGNLPLEGRTSSDDATVCNWERADVSDVADVAAFSVSIERGPGESTPIDLFADEDMLEVVPDRAVEAAGGVAYAVVVDTGGVTMVASTVQLPDVQVTTVSSSAGSLPEMSAQDGVDISKKILDIG